MIFINNFNKINGNLLIFYDTTSLFLFFSTLNAIKCSALLLVNWSFSTLLSFNKQLWRNYNWCKKTLFLAQIFKLCIKLFCMFIPNNHNCYTLTNIIELFLIHLYQFRRLRENRIWKNLNSKYFVTKIVYNND